MVCDGRVIRRCTVRYPDQPRVSPDPAIQAALEQIVVDYMVTYHTVLRCFLYLPSVNFVRFLVAKLASYGYSQEQIIQAARTVADK